MNEVWRVVTMDARSVFSTLSLLGVFERARARQKQSSKLRLAYELIVIYGKPGV